MIQSFILPFSLFLVLLTAAYHLLLKPLKAPTVKRYTILLMVPFSALLTYFQFSQESIPQTVVWLNEVAINSTLSQSIESSISTLAITYLIGVFAMLIWHFIGALKLFKMTIGATPKKENDIPYWYSPNIPHIFSFGNRIFSGKEYPDLTILEHEQQHIKQLHVIDQMWFVVLKTLLWFHPMVYVLALWSEENNEVQVDDKIATSEDAKQPYIQLLKVEAVKKIYPEWVMPFSKMKQLKNRINMMNQKKQSRKALSLTTAICGLILAVAPIVNSSCSKGAEVKEVQEESASTLQNEQKKTEALQVAEVMPAYPGGNEAMFQHIIDEVKYPKSASAENKEGKVLVSFIVGKDGSLSDIHVLKGFDGACDAEAIRVVKAMPNWTPGEQDGEKVPVKLVLPIKFQLS